MKYKGYLIITTIIRVTGDIFTLYLSFVLSFWLRFYSGLVPTHLGIPGFELYQEAFVIGLLLILVVFKAFGLYDEKNLYKFHKEAFLIIKAFATGVILVMALTFIHREMSFSRLVVGLFWLIGMVLLMIVRYAVALIEPYVCRWRREFKKVLILGVNDNAFKLIKNIREHPRWGYEIVGFVSQDPIEKIIPEINGVPVAGTLRELEKILERLIPDEVIITITGLPHEAMVDIIKKCEKNLVSVKLVPDMFEIITSKVDIYDIDGVPLLGIKELPLEYAWNRFIKRAFDIIGSIIGLIVTSPLYLIIPPLIKLTSKGPVFYKQARCGEDGKVFTLYKFRTMYEDAESQTGPVWATENDPRCTWIGRILRRLSLDEGISR